MLRILKNSENTLQKSRSNHLRFYTEIPLPIVICTWDSFDLGQSLLVWKARTSTVLFWVLLVRVQKKQNQSSQEKDPRVHLLTHSQMSSSLYSKKTQHLWSKTSLLLKRKPPQITPVLAWSVRNGGRHLLVLPWRRRHSCRLGREFHVQGVLGSEKSWYHLSYTLNLKFRTGEWSATTAAILRGARRKRRGPTFITKAHLARTRDKFSEIQTEEPTGGIVPAPETTRQCLYEATWLLKAIWLLVRHLRAHWCLGISSHLVL